MGGPTRLAVSTSIFLKGSILAIFACLLFLLVRTACVFLFENQKPYQMARKLGVLNGFQNTNVTRSNVTAHRSCCALTMFLQEPYTACSAEDPVSKDPERSMADPRCWPPHACVGAVILADTRNCIFLGARMWALSVDPPHIARCSASNRSSYLDTANPKGLTDRFRNHSRLKPESRFCGERGSWREISTIFLWEMAPGVGSGSLLQSLSPISRIPNRGKEAAPLTHIN